jgi:hypothetical protein
MSFIISGKRGLRSGTLEISELVIGNSSHTHLALDDPAIAPRHCVIRFVAGDYQIEDLGSATGTYVDGGAVTRPERLPPRGCTIILGHCRIKAKVEPATGALLLDVEEGGFFYDRLRDPAMRARMEVELGTSRALRRGIEAALLVAAGLVLYVAFFPDTSEILEPGPLLRVHEEAALAALERGAYADKCAACHEPWRGVSVGRCDACHDVKMADGGRFPYWSAEEWDRQGRSCEECHLEHQGAGADSRILPDFRSIWKRSEVRVGSPLPVRTAWTARRLTLNTFSHQKHLVQRRTCEECHRRSAGTGTFQDEPAEREFASLTFEECMRCHDPDNIVQESRELMYVAWHGTDDPASKCLSCHTANHVAERQQVPREVRPESGRLFLRSGQETARDGVCPRDPLLDAARCDDCHRQGTARPTGPFGRFRHVTHLGSSPAEQVEQCLECHAGMRDAERFADVRTAEIPEPVCQRCHAGGVPRPAHSAPAGTRPGNAFSHKLHLASSHALIQERACLACHDPGSAEPDPVPVTTREGVATCEQCHAGHQHLGLLLDRGQPPHTKGSCDRCHQAGDPAWWGPRGHPETPLVKRWPENPGFSHFSRGHVQQACDLCHDRMILAKDLMSVPIPDASHASCAPCHREQQFHHR